MKSKNKIVHKRHMFWWKFHRPIVTVICWVAGFKSKTYFKMKKGQSYIILSNHQTDLDGVIMGKAFSRPYCGLTTDTFLSKGLISKIWSHTFQLIGKKKGTVDIKSNMDMVRCINEGGSLLIFPEGNRTYAEFQYPMTPGFAKFVRHFNKPIIIYNIHGGTGTRPRFANKKRKGKFYGEIKTILEPEMYATWTDEKLEEVITENLKVYDSESGELYKSNRRAEYLERMLFVCPKCGKVQTLSSNGNHLICSSCGLDVTYNENLSISSEDKEFKFNKLVDWYNYQINFVKNYNLTDEIIFQEEHERLFSSIPGKKRKVCAEGKMTLTKDKLTIGEKIINVSDIQIASPVSGTNMALTTSEGSFLLVGSPRFNPLKYVLFFNKLDTSMKLNNRDIYYNLEERK